MMFAPKRPEIDQRTMKLIVGAVALSLAFLTSLFAETALTSISDSYWQGGWSQSIFVGFLFAIASFLLAYNGQSGREMALSKIASIAGLCVALFPCRCEGQAELVPGLHYVAAAVMFFILAYFCRDFYLRATGKGHAQAKARAVVYAVCGWVILLSMLVLGFNAVSGGSIETLIPRVNFYGEAAALMAFGISWLMASHVLPLFNRADERFSLFRQDNPPEWPDVGVDRDRSQRDH
jgi:hypothetical protein